MIRVPLVVCEYLHGGKRTLPFFCTKRIHFVFTDGDLLINSCIFVYFPY